jgi:osmoprotectant transport system substrate-binding protein
VSDNTSQVPADDGGSTAATAEETPWFKKPLAIVALVVIVAVAIWAVFALGGDDTDLAVDDTDETDEPGEQDAPEDEDAPADEEAAEDDAAEDEEANGEDEAEEPGEQPAPEVPDEGPDIVIRGQDFSEAVTLAEVYGQYLASLGYPVEQLTPAGFRDEAIQGIESGELTMIVDYIGGSLTALDPDAESSGDPDEVMDAIRPLYEDIGAVVLDYTPAIDGDAFVVRGDFDGDDISDVPDGELVFGASSQCFERPQCFLGLTDPDVYGLEFADTTTLEFGPLLGEALAAGEVDAVVWNDTAPQIEEQDFRVLTDDLGLFPAQNIAPIVADEVAEFYGQDMVDAVNSLSAQITTEDLLAWNFETDIEFREPDDVANDWLTEMGLL